MEKRTKIVATIGPASTNEKTLTKMIKSGMNVARLNFSHGDHKSHKEILDLIRTVSKKIRIPVAILQDLPGPKIRIGDFYKERVLLKKGSTFVLTTKPCLGDEKIVFVNYKNLPKELKKGSIILLDDGKKKLKVTKVLGTDIHCKVLVGGETKGRRGVNIPGAYLNISSLTEIDKKHLSFGIKNDVDFIALSFVRKAADVRKLRKILDDKKSEAKIIAKIETQEAIENIDDIIEETDGIMVARGDLAVELPPENVPSLQKKIIKKCNEIGKPVIIATQMLESMITSAVPTRAEVSDVANSILDGVDAVMLSEETALGAHPIEVIGVMSRVAHHTELDYLNKRMFFRSSNRLLSLVDAVSSSVVKVAKEVDAKAIVALTESGTTARMISRHKPKQPIIVMTPNSKTASQIILSFGCRPVIIRPFKYVARATKQVSKFVIEEGYAKKGDKVVIVAGVPFGHVGGTNLLMVHIC